MRWNSWPQEDGLDENSKILDKTFDQIEVKRLEESRAGVLVMSTEDVSRDGCLYYAPSPEPEKDGERRPRQQAFGYSYWSANAQTVRADPC